MSKIKDVVIDEMNRLREMEHEESGNQCVNAAQCVDGVVEN